MRVSDFFWKVQQAEDLKGIDLVLGGTAEEDLVVVLDLKSEVYTTYAMPVILEHDWEFLYGLARGKIDVQPLYQVSRIVGYFSRVQNWNKSKIGELEDRRKGQYSFGVGDMDRLEIPKHA